MTSRRPDEALQEFTINALEQALERLTRSSGKLAPVAMWWADGQRFAAIFDDVDGAVEGARSHVRSLEEAVERYAVVYDAVNSAGDSAIVAECGDRSGGFEFSVLYANDGGAIRPAGPISVSPMPTTLL